MGLCFVILVSLLSKFTLIFSPIHRHDTASNILVHRLAVIYALLYQTCLCHRYILESVLLVSSSGHTLQEIFILRMGRFDRIPDIVIWPGKQLKVSCQTHKVDKIFFKLCLFFFKCVFSDLSNSACKVLAILHFYLKFSDLVPGCSNSE